MPKRRTAARNDGAAEPSPSAPPRARKKFRLLRMSRKGKKDSKKSKSQPQPPPTNDENALLAPIRPAPVLRVASRRMMNPLLAASSSADLADKKGSAHSLHSLGDKIEGPQFFSNSSRRPSTIITGLDLKDSRTSPDMDEEGMDDVDELPEDGAPDGGSGGGGFVFKFSVMAQCLQALGISAKGPKHKFTVFAPTDAAFHKLFASINHVGPVTVEVLRSNRELRQMVKALVVRGAIHSSQLSNKLVVTTIGGSKLQVRRNGSGNITLAADGSSDDAERAQVIQFDHACSNGWVHAIDSVPATGWMSQARQREAVKAVVAAKAKDDDAVVVAAVATPAPAPAPAPAANKVGKLPASRKSSYENVFASKSVVASETTQSRRPFGMINSMNSISSSSSSSSATKEIGNAKKKQRRHTNGIVADPVKVAARQARYGSSAAKADSCHGCEKTVYMKEKLTVDKTVWHKACFKCTDCKCQMSIRNYACLHGKFYCKPHFQFNFKLKGNYDEGFGHTQRKSDFNTAAVAN